MRSESADSAVLTGEVCDSRTLAPNLNGEAGVVTCGDVFFELSVPSGALWCLFFGVVGVSGVEGLLERRFLLFGVACNARFAPMFSLSWYWHSVLPNIWGWL